MFLSHIGLTFICNEFFHSFTSHAIFITIRDHSSTSACAAQSAMAAQVESGRCAVLRPDHSARRDSTLLNSTSWVESRRALWSLLRPDSTQLNWLASFCQFLSVLNISVELSWVESSCRSEHSARSDSTGRLHYSCDPVFYPDVIISLLITAVRCLVFTRSNKVTRVHDFTRSLIAKTLSLFSSVRYCRFLFLFVVLLVFILYLYLHFIVQSGEINIYYFILLVILVVLCICYYVMVK